MTDETQASAAAAAQPPIARPATPSGIGGWLILPMLGMFSSLGVQVLGLFKYDDVFGHLGGLSGLQSQLIVFEFWIDLALFLAAPIALLVLFFNKSRKFPRYYIIWQIVSATFVVLDLLAGYTLFAEAYEATGTPFFDNETMRSLLGSAVGVCLWVPYMMNSVRVRNTFVK